MVSLTRKDISKLLNGIAQTIDISDTLYQSAVEKYQAVGKWLEGDGSPLAGFSPQIYPQGSFLLGTVSKPPSDADEYDLDLVFELNLSKLDMSQATLKKIVGDRLRGNEVYRKLLQPEGRRCWTLQYAESAHFHLDVLPAVPDLAFYPNLEMLGVPARQARTSTAITDKLRPNYTRIDPDWPQCNPKGYAAWFRQRMVLQFEEQRRLMAGVYKGQIERVPDFQVKTSLQRCIQLIKRHRDIRFSDFPEIKPASIILTTLAANSYGNQADIGDALVDILFRMPSYITSKNGVAWVTNPVNPSENFADRWLENSEREPAFKSWLRQIRDDMNGLVNSVDLDDISSRLSSLFGEKVSTNAVNDLKKSFNDQGIPDGIFVLPPRPAVTIKDPPKAWGKR